MEIDQATPPPLQPSQEPRLSQQDYLRNASQILLQECCLTGEALQQCQVDPSTGFRVVVHLKTRGEDNVVGFVPGHRRLYKHIFLQQKDLKQQIVDHYRALGFGWVDIVPVNRVDWKIFLWPRE